MSEKVAEGSGRQVPMGPRIVELRLLKVERTVRWWET